jgi:hypothetical protein
MENTTKKTYVVCLDSSYIRDAQMFKAEELSDEEFFEADRYDEEHENYWCDCEPDVFVAVVGATSEEDACRIAGEKRRYDPRTLYAFEPSVLE